MGMLLPQAVGAPLVGALFGARRAGRAQDPPLVRLQAHMVREVQVLFRHALSGL